MKSFFEGHFMHMMPAATYDQYGNRPIIHRACFGPIEVIEYGITADSKCYLNHSYPESLGEDDFKPHFQLIGKDRLLKAIDREIALSVAHKNSEMILALQAEKENIEKNPNIS